MCSRSRSAWSMCFSSRKPRNDSSAPSPGFPRIVCSHSLSTGTTACSHSLSTGTTASTPVPQELPLHAPPGTFAPAPGYQERLLPLPVTRNLSLRSRLHKERLPPLSATGTSGTAPAPPPRNFCSHSHPPGTSATAPGTHTPPTGFSAPLVTRKICS